MRLAASLIVLAALTATAWACPPPPSDDPRYRCSKYDYLTTPVATVYVRDARGELPRRKANVMRHLTSAGWHARADQTSQQLQLFDAADVPDSYDAWGGLQVLVQGLEQVDHVWRVTIDGAWFAVMRCKEHGAMRTCLVRQ